MRNLLILLKNSFNILLGKLQGKKERSSNVAATILFVVGILGIIALYSLQAWTMFDGLGQASVGKICMFHACTTCVSVLLILAIMRASATEKSKDNDFLLSMPIKKRSIVLSKLINKYLFDFFFVALLFVPYLVIYQIRCVFDIGILLRGLVLTFVLPLFSIGISHILDYIFTVVFGKLRFAKFLKSMATTILFVIIMILLIMTTSSYGSMIGVVDLEDYFAKKLVSNLLLKFMFTPNVLTIVIVLAISLVPFIVGFVLYLLTLGKTTETYKSKSKNLKFKASKSPYSMLLKKEFSRYITTPAYLINTIIGVIIMLVLGIFVAISGVDGIAKMLGFKLPATLLACILSLILCFASATIYISAPSISLEGKCIWFLKSQPILPRTLISAKASLHIMLVLPAIVTTSVLSAIALQFSILEFLIVLLLPSVHMLIMCYMGLLINLWVPNFDWDNETMVVKQGMSTTITMILGMLLTAGVIGLYMLFDTLKLWVAFALILGIYSAVALILIVLTYTLGVRLFKKI